MLPLTENIQTNYSKAYLQDNNCNILFDQDGNVLKPEHSTIDLERIRGTKKSIYLNQGHGFDGLEGYCCDGEWYFDYQLGMRYGLNTETANVNPTFSIDRKSGVINFSSDMAGQKCILEYVSDGMENGDNSKITVNKLFEDYIYAYIEYAILNSKFGVQEYVVNRARRRKSALLKGT